MNPLIQTAGAQAEPELFSYEWLTSAAIQSVINTAPVGICLLRSLRSVELSPSYRTDNPGFITDFQYVIVNPVLQAMLQLSAEDVLGQPLTMISPDVVRAGVINRLQQVVETGHPGGFTELYELDGISGRFYQMYFKSGDGVLMLVQDVSYRPLSAGEEQQQKDLLRAILRHAPVADIRAQLIGLVSGQAY